MGSYSWKHWIQEMGSLKNNWFSFFVLIYSVLFSPHRFCFGNEIIVNWPYLRNFCSWQNVVSCWCEFSPFLETIFLITYFLWCKNIFNLSFSLKYAETIKSSISDELVLFDVTAVYAITIFRWQVSKFKVIFWYLCVL